MSTLDDVVSNICVLQKLVHKSIVINLFAQYNTRYQEIIINFPESINEADFNFNADGIDKNKTLRYMQCYFNLCSEEFDLYDMNVITAEIFLIWKSGIEFAFSKPAFREAWGIITQHTRFNETFVKYVNYILEAK